MAYTFKSEVLQSQIESVEVAVFEGDNEIAIVDCSSNDRIMHALIVFSDEDTCILEEFYDSLIEAVAALGQFLKDEYAES